MAEFATRFATAVSVFTASGVLTSVALLRPTEAVLRLVIAFVSESSEALFQLAGVAAAAFASLVATRVLMEPAMQFRTQAAPTRAILSPTGIASAYSDTAISVAVAGPQSGSLLLAHASAAISQTPCSGLAAVIDRGDTAVTSAVLS
ncbi:MAG: hypothetical protein GY818_05150 [Planctomycetaceae bacterium]|nr:hypothetical protein [Planctomycetaceae bacterium]